MRLQKWLSQLGVASRREAETWISEGRIAVNGKVITALGTKVDPDSDSIFLNGKLVKTKLPPKVYWLLHKPDKILTARSDELTNKPTIYDLPMVAKAKFLVSPVGRLDFRTEGLLLLTNDGDLNYKLCRPEYHVPREYQVLLDGRLTKEEELEIRKGVTLEDGPTKDVKIVYVHGTNMGLSTGSWYVITVHEGRNRLVRRIFEHFEKRVVRLIRVGFGDIRLPADLLPGQYRQLTNDQVDTLRVATEHAIALNSAKRVSASKNRSSRKALSFKPRAKKSSEDDSAPAESSKASQSKIATSKNTTSKSSPSSSKFGRNDSSRASTGRASTGRTKSSTFKDSLPTDQKGRKSTEKAVNRRGVPVTEAPTKGSRGRNQAETPQSNKKSVDQKTPSKKTGDWRGGKNPADKKTTDKRLPDTKAPDRTKTPKRPEKPKSNKRG
jgi:23S rRNA pseudouridine2605 synthase